MLRWAPANTEADAQADGRAGKLDFSISLQSSGGRLKTWFASAHHLNRIALRLHGFRILAESMGGMHLRVIETLAPKSAASMVAHAHAA
ncbi:MAG: hypothetical protein LBU32_30575 [Clostridiales bacterium]|jgi:hypothetical protein|nr:hypothetical protein [Clostridiales bacterium]